MTDSILSVKAEKLAERALEILANDSSYFDNHSNNGGYDNILQIYNDLCRCNREIRQCETEEDYVRLTKEIEHFDKAISTYA